MNVSSFIFCFGNRFEGNFPEILFSSQSLSLVAFVLILAQSVVSDDFCEALRKNSNRISYVFQQLLKGSENMVDVVNNDRHHIVIGDKYWDLIYVRNKWNVIFEVDSSLASGPFTGDYSSAVCLWRGDYDNGNCVTMLFKKRVYDKAFVTAVEGNSFNQFHTLDKYSKPEEYSLTGSQLFDFELAHSTEDYNKEGIDFEVRSGQSLTRRRLQFIEATDGTKSFEVKNSSSLSEISEFVDTKEVIAINVQYRYRLNTKAKDRMGYLVLFREDQLIYWCWRPVDDPKVTHLWLTLRSD